MQSVMFSYYVLLYAKCHCDLVLDMQSVLISPCAGCFFELAVRQGATWYSSVPTVHMRLVAHLEGLKAQGGIYPAHALRIARNCSAALPPNLARRMGEALGPGCAVVPSYAMTECLPICSTAVGGLTAAKRASKRASVGLPAGPTVRILSRAADARGGRRFVALARQEGEVVVLASGACVTRGYERRAHDKERQALFHVDADGARWLQTGDLGWKDKDGYRATMPPSLVSALHLLPGTCIFKGKLFYSLSVSMQNVLIF